MPVPTIPTTAVSGQPARASAQFNALAAQVAWLLSPPLCIVTQTVTQNLTTGTFTDILFDSETAPNIDRDNGHSTVTNTARYTAQTAGYYEVEATITLAATTNAGQRDMRLLVNGTTGYRMAPAFAAVSSASLGSTCSGSRKVYLNVGDYVTVQARQDSTATLATVVADNAPYMSVQFVSQ